MTYCKVILTEKITELIYRFLKNISKINVIFHLESFENIVHTLQNKLILNTSFRLTILRKILMRSTFKKDKRVNFPLLHRKSCFQILGNEQNLYANLY